MTLQLLHSEFPYIGGKFDFLFYQCTCFVVSLLYISRFYKNCLKLLQPLSSADVRRHQFNNNKKKNIAKNCLNNKNLFTSIACFQAENDVYSILSYCFHQEIITYQIRKSYKKIWSNCTALDCDAGLSLLGFFSICAPERQLMYCQM